MDLIRPAHRVNKRRSSLSRKFIVPIFVVNEACPGGCVFCRFKSLVGRQKGRVDPESIAKTVRTYLTYPRQRPKQVELAFYGGSFTALERAYQIELLAVAQSLRRQGLIDAVRISTRPDCLCKEELELLEEYQVKTVEIGAQSLCDEVLIKAGRGHTADDVVSAIARLKERGVATGIHLMAGLPGDSREGFVASVRKTIALQPDLVRVHPTLVLAHTPLAESFYRGEYQPLTQEEAIWAGRAALTLFAAARIPVARLGIQATEELGEPGVIIAGYYHPAMRARVEESLFFDMAAKLLAAGEPTVGGAEFFVAPRDKSNFIGHRRGNILRLMERFAMAQIEVKTLDSLERGELILKANNASRKITMDSMAFVM